MTDLQTMERLEKYVAVAELKVLIQNLVAFFTAVLFSVLLALDTYYSRRISLLLFITPALGCALGLSTLLLWRSNRVSTITYNFLRYNYILLWLFATDAMFVVKILFL